MEAPRWFDIFHGDTLIGRSRLEDGDPPMGVAFGRFEPTDAFFALQGAMELAPNDAQTKGPAVWVLRGATVTQPDGAVVACEEATIAGLGIAPSPEWEVCCFGIAYPLYAELLPSQSEPYRGDSGHAKDGGQPKDR